MFSKPMKPLVPVKWKLRTIFFVFHLCKLDYKFARERLTLAFHYWLNDKQGAFGGLAFPGSESTKCRQSFPAPYGGGGWRAAGPGRPVPPWEQ